MPIIEALQKFSYAQIERVPGDQFEAEVGHARGLVAAGKAKYAYAESTVRPAPEGRTPKKAKR